MNFILLLASTAFAFRRMLSYLHYFQQDEYDGARFLRNLVAGRSFDTRLSAALAIAAVIARTIHLGYPVTTLGTAAIFLCFALFESDPRRAAKKPLVITARARRTLAAALCITALLGLALLYAGPVWIWILYVQALPLMLVAGGAFLQPLEERIQKRYWNEAHEKLKAFGTYTIGITGSFGKTSVKHILAHILSMGSEVLMTPGSVNTPMGIARVVREKLTSRHKYFVCEMGAYGPGSIDRLCKLAPPRISTITSVGYAHYERFKSLETVSSTKFELAENTVSNGGIVVVSEAAANEQSARNFVAKHRDSVRFVGTGENSEYQIRSIVQSAKGIHVEIIRNNETYKLDAPLFGEHQGSNIALAFALACELGVSPGDCAAALRSVPQTKHRLEVLPQSGGWTKIDDAYNSNPTGFKSALGVLALVPGDRKILVTPGMVELGAAHDEQHALLGEIAAKSVDILVVVAPERIPTFVSSFRANSVGGEVYELPNFSAAAKWLIDHVKAGDVVLLENDLPDIYERRLNF